jgi:ComF family protein
MARLTWPDDVVTERSAIIPVPLAAERLAQRGYNQSEYLARFLARYWQIPVWSGVVRRRVVTRSQARLTAAARLRNVAGAFEVVVPGTLLEGKHLILLDDVITTGATMNSCAAELFAAGARTLSYITFGRARLPGDAP